MQLVRYAPLALLVVACAKTAPPEEAAKIVNPHPDLHCPANTIPAGKAPPQGYKVWCHQQISPGKWVRQGPTITWHDNEERASEGLYARDRKTGPWQFWYPTGQPSQQGGFVGGVKDGVWVSYHSDGQRESEGQMVDGKQHGEWNYWAEDGQTRTVGSWNLGNKDGVWNDFNAEDRAITERVFRSGRLISQKGL